MPIVKCNIHFSLYELYAQNLKIIFCIKKKLYSYIYIYGELLYHCPPCERLIHFFVIFIISRYHLTNQIIECDSRMCPHLFERCLYDMKITYIRFLKIYFFFEFLKGSASYSNMEM